MANEGTSLLGAVRTSRSSLAHGLVVLGLVLTAIGVLLTVIFCSVPGFKEEYQTDFGALDRTIGGVVTDAVLALLAFLLSTAPFAECFFRERAKDSKSAPASSSTSCGAPEIGTALRWLIVVYDWTEALGWTLGAYIHATASVLHARGDLDDQPIEYDGRSNSVPYPPQIMPAWVVALTVVCESQVAICVASLAFVLAPWLRTADRATSRSFWCVIGTLSAVGVGGTAGAIYVGSTGDWTLNRTYYCIAQPAVAIAAVRAILVTAEGGRRRYVICMTVGWAMLFALAMLINCGLIFTYPSLIQNSAWNQNSLFHVLYMGMLSCLTALALEWLRIVDEDKDSPPGQAWSV
jgi:hypothetical protein